MILVTAPHDHHINSGVVSKNKIAKPIRHWTAPPPPKNGISVKIVRTMIYIKLHATIMCSRRGQRIKLFIMFYLHGPRNWIIIFYSHDLRNCIIFHSEYNISMLTGYIITQRDVYYVTAKVYSSPFRVEILFFCFNFTFKHFSSFRCV